MKRLTAALLIGALCALLLAGCDKEPEPSPPPPDTQQPVAVAPAPATPEARAVSDPNVRTVRGLDVYIPAEYADLLLVETELEAWSEHWEPLLSLSEKKSVEEYERDEPGEEHGMGWLCSITRLDRIGFEDWASSGDDTGTTLFARDDAGRYYVISQPTDVRFYRSGMSPDLSLGVDPAELSKWTELNDWAHNALADDIVKRNHLTAYTAADLFESDYTYPGEHVDLGYRFPGEPRDLVILSISQPAKQGEGGIWCVERVREVYSEYNFTDTHLVFPAALGFDETAEDYYAALQSAADAGQDTSLLTPDGAAVSYARQVPWLFGEDVSASDFEVIDALG